MLGLQWAFKPFFFDWDPGPAEFLSQHPVLQNHRLMVARDPLVELWASQTGSPWGSRTVELGWVPTYLHVLPQV